LNFCRIQVSSGQSLDGKLFVEFLTLIYMLYIKNAMQEKQLFQRYTMQELLDELDVIECYERPGYDLQYGETTKRQLELFAALGIPASTSLLFVREFRLGTSRKPIY